MDDLVYVAMTGLRQAEKLQTVISHNIANASTIGFRAEVPLFSSEEIMGDGLDTRVNTLEVGADWNDASGAMMSTGRDLDVAIRGNGSALRLHCVGVTLGRLQRTAFLTKG